MVLGDRLLYLPPYLFFLVVLPTAEFIHLVEEDIGDLPLEDAALIALLPSFSKFAAQTQSNQGIRVEFELDRPSDRFTTVVHVELHVIGP